MVPSPPPAPPVSPLWRFSLRRLLIYVAALSALFAFLSTAGTPLAIAVVGVLLIVGGHVVGSAFGTRLRDGATARQRFEREHGIVATDPKLAVGVRPAPVAELELPSDHPLSGREPTVKRLTWIVVAGGAIGLTVGAWLLYRLLGDRISIAGIAVGAISTCVLAAWIALLASSFYGVSRTAWKQAATQPATKKRDAR